MNILQGNYWSICINELEKAMKRNNEDRMMFIDFWIDFMRNNSNEVWSIEQNRLINYLVK